VRHTYVYETIVLDHVVGEMVHDEDGGNPRKEYDNVGTILAWVPHYDIGEQNIDPDYLTDLRVALLESAGEAVLCTYCGEPIEITQPYDTDDYYLHSETYEEVIDLDDVTDRDKLCGGNPIQPDLSGVVAVTFSYRTYDGSIYVHDEPDWRLSESDGMIFATRGKVLEEWGSSDDPIEMAFQCLRGELKEYSEFLQGNSWGIVISVNDDGEPGEELDACWGYLGTEYAETVLKDETEGWEAAEARRRSEAA
jgi:hypothetical protein